MDKDKQALDNENLYKGCSDCLCALEKKSNDNEDEMRSNRGFFNYFGFNSNSKENDKNIAKNRTKSSHKVSTNKGENKSKQIGRRKSKASSEIEGKGEFKPGTLYDEYMKQIGKIIDVPIS
ncbi:hypothetical protein FF38_07846 [Lucilia cuprina]|uniref:Uncharacterized protein n=1 Tax=Lucilia cuprina TaxID=7375 RepID=A0A0L0BXV7_LUCCU|nr:hypothetical protein FF38_07846 [Lucilia cuprina]